MADASKGTPGYVGDAPGGTTFAGDTPPALPPLASINLSGAWIGPPTKDVVLKSVPPGMQDSFSSFWDLVHGSLPSLLADGICVMVQAVLSILVSTLNTLGTPAATLKQEYDRVGQTINKADPITTLDYATLAELRRRYPNSIQLFNDHLRRQGYGDIELSALEALLENLTPEPTTVEAYRRDLATEQETITALKARGYNDRTVKNILATSFQQLDPTATLAAWLRGIIADNAIDGELSSLGYSSDDINRLKALTQVIPGVADLVTMAVKEAFNPEQIKLLDLDQEFPPDFGKYAKQQGLADEWAHRYWQAHWQLPSPTATYEMHHRTTDVQTDPSSPALGNVKGKPYFRLISGDTLAKLLKAQDYAPVWRDRLQQISFNLLTRVDIERMFALGIMDEDEVYRAYIDDGYTEVNARRLTDFVVSDTTRSAIGSILSDLQAKYVEGIATEDELRALYTEAKWSQDRIQLLVDGLKLKRKLRVREHVVMAIKKQYFNHLIEDGLLLATIIPLGVPADAALLLYQEWKVERETQLTRLRIQDVAKAYSDGLIDKTRLERMLKDRHFPADDITLFEQIHAPKPPAS